MATKHYRKVMLNGDLVAVHQLRAQVALGKPLPEGSSVHHADGSKDENAQLVICQDESYHRLLHARMRVKAAGGNPNTDKICARCKALKVKAEFNVCRTNYDGLAVQCRACVSVINAKQRTRRKAMDAA